MNTDNFMELTFPARSENESFARVCAAAFSARLDCTVEESPISKTAILRGRHQRHCSRLWQGGRAGNPARRDHRQPRRF